jgi:hypothetical protein
MEKIVIVRLIGGLGNQLFQLQKGFILSRELNSDLQIDTSYFDFSKKAHEKLVIKELLKTRSIIRLSKFTIIFERYFERLIFKIGFSRWIKYQRQFLFEGDILDLRKMRKIIVDGFWQGVDSLDDEFLSFVRIELQRSGIKKIQANKVCVHVRRGDYLTNRNWFFRSHLVTPLSYYTNSFNYYREILVQPVFEVYSDDEEWALEVFKDFNDVKVIKSATLHPLDLLMNMCSYPNFVIANSTLSWWAAVISNFDKKKVVMPKVWGKETGMKKFRCNEWVCL